MKHSKLSILMAMFLIVSASTALAKGGGGGGGPGGGIGGGPGAGIGGPHGGSVGAGVPSPGSLPGLPSHVPGSGLPSHAPRAGLPQGSPPGLPHAPMPQTSVNNARGLDRAASRMSPQGLKNTNNPRSPNRAHGRARAAERHAMADLPGRR
jgi:hypothetical protein